MTRSPLTRRGFLAGCAGLAAGALGITACSEQAEQPPKPTVRDVASAIIDQMSIEEKAAQLFIVSPERITEPEDPVVSIDDAFREVLATRPVCGFNFWENNVIDAAQTSGLIASIKNAAAVNGAIPMFCCVDEEGGTVKRVSGRSDFGVADVGNMADIGVTQDVALAAEAAHIMGQGLRTLGFDVDFAPSCDIATSPASDMRRRSFGADASLVSEMAVAQIEAFAEDGILCCAKHFPGIGEPEGDSHVSSISTNKTREELADQLVPFEAAIAAGVPFVMVGHLAVPQVTGSDIPASISPDIIQGILRDELGYDGVVLTDSLGMGAILEFCPPQDVGVAAIEAGCDIALMPPDFASAYDGLVAAINEERISMERIDESLMRIIFLKLSHMPQEFDEATQELLAQCE